MLENKQYVPEASGEKNEINRNISWDCTGKNNIPKRKAAGWEQKDYSPMWELTSD